MSSSVSLLSLCFEKAACALTLLHAECFKEFPTCYQILHGTLSLLFRHTHTQTVCMHMLLAWFARPLAGSCDLFRVSLSHPYSE